MRVVNVVLLAFLSAFWIYGLLDQFHSLRAVILYLALSLLVVAIGVWRWLLPQRKLKPLKRRKHRDRRDPRP